MPNTDHSEYIRALREHNSVQSCLAAELLEMHDATGISLDNWSNAQEFIRMTLDYIEAGANYELVENGV